MTRFSNGGDSAKNKGDDGHPKDDAEYVGHIPTTALAIDKPSGNANEDTCDCQDVGEANPASCPKKAKVTTKEPEDTQAAASDDEIEQAIIRVFWWIEQNGNRTSRHPQNGTHKWKQLRDAFAMQIHERPLTEWTSGSLA